jgi:hypothetical protein
MNCLQKTLSTESWQILEWLQKFTIFFSQLQPLFEGAGPTFGFSSETFKESAISQTLDSINPMLSEFKNEIRQIAEAIRYSMKVNSDAIDQKDEVIHNLIMAHNSQFQSLYNQEVEFQAEMISIQKESD